MTDSIYLDHNASAPMLPQVADAIREASLRFGANPASQHRAGQDARRALENARERIAELLGGKTTGMDADRLIFTSGGTEANNLVLAGMLASLAPGHLITSAIEHPAILEPVSQLESRGWRVTRIGVDGDGVVRVDELREALCPETRLVSIMAANNETGVLQPLSQIAEACLEHAVALHTDAAQLAGKLPAEFSQRSLTALSCAAHKFHGPVGIGALLVRHDVQVAPQMWGGHQQAGVRPGTEMVALAVGMQVAMEAWHQDAEGRLERMKKFQMHFEEQIVAVIESATVIGKLARRLPNTSNIAFPDIDRQPFFLALDQAGVACSTGSACASGSSEASPVLEAMGLKKELVESALRFSWGATTVAAEIDEACRRIIKAHKHLQR
ncbi:cysteine desulfurase family protein [Bythopirellula polymerisocia]|uniref:Cysteine desulfurase n=1 Tax=Bythopirellula polymerisocia TaxID=2528003 RepID=A0A5C6CY97_9BACT|nr:cysteine desulfurase family protein [Bythopirellula polymerisocia]TWU29913.1 Cysteine desulfurase [Bythopirellula polymerisocia]